MIFTLLFLYLFFVVYDLTRDSFHITLDEDYFNFGDVIYISEIESYAYIYWKDSSRESSSVVYEVLLQEDCVYSFLVKIYRTFEDILNYLQKVSNYAEEIFNIRRWH